jgi:hypothetical protein
VKIYGSQPAKPFIDAGFLVSYWDSEVQRFHAFTGKRLNFHE